MADRPTVLIMAAGRGTRMRSSLPKVLHPVCGRPMLDWVIGAAREAGAGRIVCVTRPGDGVAEVLPEGVEHAEQRTGEGTAAAVLAARDALDSTTVVTLSGDHPLVSPEVIREMVGTHDRAGAAGTLLTTDAIDPDGYGRVVRGPDGGVERLVETKHPESVRPEELAIREINVGAYAFDGRALAEALEAIPEEGNGERYLTAVFPILRERGLSVVAHATDDPATALGINDRASLMEVEAIARRRLIERHARAGVTFALPETIFLDADVEIGPDTRIEPGTILRGGTRVGSGCEIGPYTTAVDAEIGDGATVRRSHLASCRVASGATIGPFAHLRPEAEVGEGAKVGTFVEVKKSRIGRGAKVPHLTYLGDADVGEEANVGAGNVTANYDGRAKHRTTIGTRARTGVNTSFVAPVRIGEGAYTGAGSVITDDVPDGALGISRPKQENVEGYADRQDSDRERR